MIVSNSIAKRFKQDVWDARFGAAQGNKQKPIVFMVMMVGLYVSRLLLWVQDRTKPSLLLMLPPASLSVAGHVIAQLGCMFPLC